MDVCSVSSFITVASISASGALSPGPLTVAVVSSSMRGYGWKGGLWASAGHMIFELPYVLFLAFLLTGVGIQVFEQRIISLLGALALVIYACLIFRDVRKSTLKREAKNKYGHPLVIGFLFTALNPYFLVWWGSIGLNLVVMFASGEIHTLLVMYAYHIWLDYIWLIFIAYLAQTGKKVLSLRSYKILLIALGIVMLVFAADFMHYSLTQYRLISL